jgi:formylglycine-generating enzyme required for sulfatase activity
MSYPSNAFGLYDMHGNVWELCRDCYAVKTDDLGEKDPERTATQADAPRVMRGGCFNCRPDICRAAHRGYNSPETRNAYGFRVIVLP